MRYTQEPLGSHVNFSNGKTSPARDTYGRFPIYGSNGQIGFSDHQNAPPQTSIIGRVGTYCGSVHFSKNACWITDNAIKAVAKEQKEARFWFYAMLHRDLHDLRSGSGQPLINQSALNNTMVSVPPDPLARIEIAALLAALDDKIELNRKTASTLEEMARALYRSWFVDFDPVHAKVEGRAPAHMDAKTAVLFPDRFGEDGVPEGWTKGTISSFGEIITGKTPNTKDSLNFGDFCPFIKIPDMHGKMYVTKPTSYLSKIGAEKQRRQMLPAGSVSVSCIATPGLVTINPVRAQTNQQINSIMLNDEFSTEFVYWSCVEVANEVLLGGSGGSVFHNMNKSTFSSIPVGLTNPKIRAAFTDSVLAWHEKILQLDYENQTLAELRDTLLPRLMSGELRVPTAREMIEEVA